MHGAGRARPGFVPLPQPPDPGTLLAPRPSLRADPPQRSHIRACSFFCELAEADIIHKEPAA
ncbi:conserved hypothetical protein [Pseudomonas aeruginosa 2192]|nr:conserved hypothetical protein [Pseudomonas aeruginosa 2192]